MKKTLLLALLMAASAFQIKACDEPTMGGDGYFVPEASSAPSSSYRPPVDKSGIVMCLTLMGMITYEIASVVKQRSLALAEKASAALKEAELVKNAQLQAEFIRKQAVLLSRAAQTNPAIKDIDTIATQALSAPPSFYERMTNFIGENKVGLGLGACALVAGAYGSYKLYNYITKPSEVKAD